MYQAITGTGDGTAPVVNLTWPYLSRDHVKASAGGAEVSYTWTGASQITLAVVATGVEWKVYRQTPATPLVDFTDGSVLTEADLDLATSQPLFIAEETQSDSSSTSAALSLKADLTGATFTGPVKVPNEAYDGSSWNGNTEVPTKNSVRDIVESKADLTGATFTGPVKVPNEAYDGSSWNGNTEVPTKNSVRDIVESLILNSARPSGYVSPDDPVFGAVGDGVTNDTTAVAAALSFAFQNGLPLDGGDKVYGVSGTLQFSDSVRPHIRRLRLRQLALTDSTQTLYLLNCDHVRIDSLFIDTGTDATVGDRDTTTLGLRIEGGSGHRVNVEATGSGMGAHVRILSCIDSEFDVYVHDGLFSKTEMDPTGINVIDDVLEGIRFNDNLRCKLRPRVARLHGNATYFTRSGYVLDHVNHTANYPSSTKKAFPSLRTRGISGGGNEDCVIDNPQIYDVDQGIDLSGMGNGYGNMKVTVNGGHALDCASVGLKWGACMTDCKILGFTAENCGMYGYILSGSLRGIKTTGVEMVGCSATGIGYNDIQNDIGNVDSATYIENAYFGAIVIGGYAADSIEAVRLIGCRSDGKCYVRLYGDDPVSDPARPWPVAGSTTAYLVRPWTGPTGDYAVTFDTSTYFASDGSIINPPTIRSEDRVATFTSGSAVITWSGGLANPVQMPMVARPSFMAYGYGSVLTQYDALSGLDEGAAIPFNKTTKKPIELIDCESFGHTIARQIGGFHRDVCHVTEASNQTLTTGVATGVRFTTEIEDTMDMHSTSSDIELVRPQRPGWYRVSGYVRFSPTSTGIRLLQVVKLDVVQFEIPAASIPGQACVIQFDEEIQFTADDVATGSYVSIRATQTSGADLDLAGQRYLKVERVRPL